MKVTICLVAWATLFQLATAHVWLSPPPQQSFHESPSEVIETFVRPNGIQTPSQEQPRASFQPSRVWKSDGVFLFRPLSAANGGLDSRLPLHSPLMERLTSSSSGRPRFSSFYKDWNHEENGKRRRQFRGIKGEINVKWAVLPIWGHTDGGEMLRRGSREAVFTSRRRYFPAMPSSEPRPFSEENTQDKEDNRRTGRRVRRQIGSWNPQPMLNRLFSNATGLFENLGRQMSRQLQNLEGAGRAASGAFQSVQENFKRFAKSVNLNISQLRPERLFSQLASLTRA